MLREESRMPAWERKDLAIIKPVPNQRGVCFDKSSIETGRQRMALTFSGEAYLFMGAQWAREGH